MGQIMFLISWSNLTGVSCIGESFKPEKQILIIGLIWMDGVNKIQKMSKNYKNERIFPFLIILWAEHKKSRKSHQQVSKNGQQFYIIILSLSWFFNFQRNRFFVEDTLLLRKFENL
jgi:hypothetical protein